MTGMIMLCGSCYGDQRNHSKTVETVLISPSDKHYIGSPDKRYCDQCRGLVPYGK